MRKGHALHRKRTLPKDPQAITNIIRALSREIKRIGGHFLEDPSHFSNIPARLSFEQKIDERAEAIRVLRDLDPQTCQNVIHELELTERG